MRPGHGSADEAGRGFTRLELLVLLTVLALLVAVASPVRGSTGLAKSLGCMENLRRLSAAWMLYADDNGGQFVGNYHGGFSPLASATERPWAVGWLDWGTSSDNTNVLYLTTLRYAALSPYLGQDTSVYKCPADDYLSPAQAARGWSGRVRTYSLSVVFGEGNAETGPFSLQTAHLRRRSDPIRLSPQAAFVFLDEHPDSVNDPLFFVPNSPQNIVDVPGSHHEGAAWFTFADGHLELRRWESPELRRPVRLRSDVNVFVAPGNPDLQWLLDHTPQR